MLDPRLLSFEDAQLLRWQAEGLTTRAMATRLCRSLNDVNQRLTAVLEAQRRFEVAARSHEQQVPKRPRHDPHAELRARVLAQWAEAAARFENKDKTPPPAA